MKNISENANYLNDCIYPLSVSKLDVVVDQKGAIFTPESGEELRLQMGRY